MYHFVKGKTSHQAHVGLPSGTFEDEHGGEGFYGPVSHLYRTHRPTDWTRIEGPLKPRAFDCRKVAAATKGQNPVDDRRPVLRNEDVVMHVARATLPMDFYFRNADGDEVYFVHEGQGKIETDYGPLSYQRGDYIVIPRGTTYRVIPKTEENFFLIIESRGLITQPDRGLLGQHALYDPALIETPEPAAIESEGREWEVRIKRLNEMTSVYYPFSPMDVIGWKGNLTAWKLSIYDICPVMSHRAHLPPSVHTTFLGENFVICSFVPRPFESEPTAERVPFYHRNIDYDEVLFYHDGDFFSRHGIDAGMITFHPQGIHHGPHPQAQQNVKNKTETDEVAVMVDTRHPLMMTPEAHDAEWKEYYLSWQPSAV